MNKIKSILKVISYILLAIVILVINDGCQESKEKKQLSAIHDQVIYATRPSFNELEAKIDDLEQKIRELDDKIDSLEK